VDAGFKIGAPPKKTSKENTPSLETLHPAQYQDGVCCKSQGWEIAKCLALSRAKPQYGLSYIDSKEKIMAAIEFAVAGVTASDKADNPVVSEQQIRILSVSPDEGDHTELRQILDELPFQVTAVRSGREAAASLDAGQFDVILCECRLPDGTWLEILNQISGAPATTLLIVTSRIADASLWAEVLNLGGYDLLAKPFNRQEVRHVLTSAWVQSSNPVRHASAAGAA
jgi:CheY-like chemotaxis protein